MFEVSFASVFKIPFSQREAIPDASFLKDLTYDQNRFALFVPEEVGSGLLSVGVTTSETYIQ